MRPLLPLLVLAACGDPTLSAPSASDPSCGLVPGDEGAFVAQGGSVSGSLPGCRRAVHATAGAIGSTLAIRLDEGGPSRLVVTDLLGGVLSEGPVEAGVAIDVTLPQSGEVLVHLEGTGAYALSVSCAGGCDAEYTRYPIVLFHGAGPSDVAAIDYFWGVADGLGERGFLVLTPEVDPFASTEGRAAQWAKQLDELVAAGIGRKFDVIGHSQGGIDARRVVSGLGYEDRVAAVITVASPHRGSTVADVAAGIVDLAPGADALVDAAADAVAAAFGLSDTDAMGTLATLNTDAMAEFNALNPDAPGVYYASWAGHSCGILEWSCIEAHDGEIVTPLLGPTYTLLRATDGPNDGMVPVASAVWGDFQGEIPADHFDEVGQILGVTGAFDHRAFYLSEARRLGELGL